MVNILFIKTKGFLKKFFGFLCIGSLFFYDILFSTTDERGDLNMSISQILMYFTQYGGIAIFVIVFLEYLNLPGFPAGVIMPLAGVWAAKGHINFIAALFITIMAGLLGSYILYFLGLKGGEIFLKKYIKRFPKQKPAIDRNMELIRQKGCMGIFFAKLIPMVRTLISIPAGVMKMDFLKYTISSLCGIFVWNLVFVGAGYMMGESILQWLG